MPSINEVIERNDKIKPNSFDEATKADWLYRLDGRISKEIMHTEPPVQYVYPDDGDKELLVPFPFDAIYDYYLQSMIDYTNREFASYNNSMIMFNEAYDAFAKQYIRDNVPPSFFNFRNVMG